MMLENNLRIIMAKKMINSVSELITITGISRNALNKLWHNKDVETIKLETLIGICDKLDVSLDELIKYNPEQKEKTPD